MWDDLERSYDALSPSDQTALEQRFGALAKNPKFDGFDGNRETEYMGIASFMIEKLGRFQGFAGRGLNSHTPTVETYRRMLGAFSQIGRRARVGRWLTRQELEPVLAEYVRS